MPTDDSSQGWLDPPARLDLQPGQVDVWRADLKVSRESLEWLEATLSRDEAGRAGRFHFQIDRERFIASHGCLREILGRYLRCQPAQVDFSTGPYGKPEIVTESPGEKLGFNLAHSGDLALIAVTRGGRVGVDLELVRPGLSILDLARRNFSASEFSELTSLTPSQREAAFFNGWTRKEAYIKAWGLGLSLPLDRFDVSLDPEMPAMLLATRPDPGEVERWTLRNLYVHSGYAAALVLEGRVDILNQWNWKSQDQGGTP